MDGKINESILLEINSWYELLNNQIVILYNNFSLQYEDFKSIIKQIKSQSCIYMCYYLNLDQHINVT